MIPLGRDAKNAHGQRRGRDFIRTAMPLDRIINSSVNLHINRISSPANSRQLL